MRAFVTGASGFIGRSLVPHLRAHGYIVRALARSDSSASVVIASGAEAVRADLLNTTALTDAMRGCDVVFHLAASTKEWAPLSEFMEMNVDGTKSALTAARSAGVKRFVHVSTEAVLLNGSPLIQVDETQPLPTNPIGAYASSKALAEQNALAANSNGFEVVVVRPRFVWGRGDTTLVPKLVAMVKAGRFAWIDGGRAMTSTCHVENVCEGMVLAAEKGRPGAVYFLTDGAPVQTREFLTDLLRTQGVDPGDKSIPFGIALMTASLTEAIWRLFGVQRVPPIQRTGVLLIGQEMTVSDRKAREELGYQSIKTMEAGLREMNVERNA